MSEWFYFIDIKLSRDILPQLSPNQLDHEAPSLPFLVQSKTDNNTHFAYCCPTIPLALFLTLTCDAYELGIQMGPPILIYSLLSYITHCSTFGALVTSIAFICMLHCIFYLYIFSREFKFLLLVDHDDELLSNFFY